LYNFVCELAVFTQNSHSREKIYNLKTIYGVITISNYTQIVAQIFSYPTSIMIIPFG